MGDIILIYYTKKEIFMKKMHFVLFLVIGCAFLFFSCEVTGKPDSTIPDLVEIAKSNNQGEDNDDQGGKPKPPVVNPPDKISASISISMRTGFPSFPEGGARTTTYSADVIVMLTLSEGAWNNFSYPWVFNDAFIAEKARLSKWFTSTFSDIIATSIESGYEYIGMDDHLFGAIKTSNPKVLSFRFPNDLGAIIPSNVTLDERKLDEMKAATNITGNLTAGSKSATITDLWLW